MVRNWYGRDKVGYPAPSTLHTAPYTLQEVVSTFLANQQLALSCWSALEGGALAPLGLEGGALAPLGLEGGALAPLGLEGGALAPLGLEGGALAPLGPCLHQYWQLKRALAPGSQVPLIILGAGSIF